jgi:hypothetical protein
VHIDTARDLRRWIEGASPVTLAYDSRYTEFVVVGESRRTSARYSAFSVEARARIRTLARFSQTSTRLDGFTVGRCRAVLIGKYSATLTVRSAAHARTRTRDLSTCIKATAFYLSAMSRALS